ncbi:uncharacterized protein SETTUDRAFT_33239 [Exserohilum turcica Et28A]|uniref:Uncharacterized protein n=1 Tax=Exserohilum turcicum (strain 28A) TaxID=671987 RepID=R0K3U4_EXST2|nr:uncharacterized protein SETTUDRAFT_33239 [Exserohilum turcica Et28A]EOA84239.1 hypothetical protein SETTUDRAFT_33239 [Exserohilum turcica Et28A]
MNLYPAQIAVTWWKSGTAVNTVERENLTNAFWTVWFPGMRFVDMAKILCLNRKPAITHLNQSESSAKCVHLNSNFGVQPECMIEAQPSVTYHTHAMPLVNDELSIPSWKHLFCDLHEIPQGTHSPSMLQKLSTTTRTHFFPYLTSGCILHTETKASQTHPNH